MATANEDDGPDELEERTRVRLRQLRFECGLTVAGLATAAGLAPSTVSRLETGERRLTLRHVATLARALGVTTDDVLVRRPTPVDAARRPRTRDGKTWWPLTDERSEGPRAYRVEIPSDLREPDPRTHEGHQWVYVLRGRLRVVAGAHDAVVPAGEAIEFSTWLPHWVGAVDEAVEVLVIFSPDGAPLRGRSVPAGGPGRSSPQS